MKVTPKNTCNVYQPPGVSSFKIELTIITTTAGLICIKCMYFKRPSEMIFIVLYTYVYANNTPSQPQQQNKTSWKLFVCYT